MKYIILVLLVSIAWISFEYYNIRKFETEIKDVKNEVEYQVSRLTEDVKNYKSSLQSFENKNPKSSEDIDTIRCFKEYIELESYHIQQYNSMLKCKMEESAHLIKYNLIFRYR